MPYHIHEILAEKSAAVFRALGSETRCKIVDMLADGDKNINELSTALGLAQPSITKHVQILEEAGLVTKDYKPGLQGLQTRCHLVHERILVELATRTPRAEFIAEIELPIGMYSNVEAASPCGLATKDKLIGLIDNPLSFYLPERAQAELLWSSTSGYVEYRFANTLPLHATVSIIELVMEVGSEAPGYDNYYPSDITVWINDQEIGTWTSPGDFGGTRGRLNPSWWPDNMNQFGVLKVWQVDRTGASIDGVELSPVKVDELGVKPWQGTKVRIGVKPDAVNRGGFTLFGKGFGNYEVGLVLRITHETDNLPTVRKKNGAPQA
jgi:predicted transcriptional regulator